MRRIFLNTIFNGDKVAIHDPEIIHRMHSVLRMQVGDECYVFDSSGTEYLAKIISADKDQVVVEFIKPVMNGTEAKVRLNLYPALFKKQRFEWMLEKCTELGVSGFYPIITEHSVIQELEGSNVAERWNKIIVSASEQSERVSVPVVRPAQSLAEALKTVSGRILVATERLDSTQAWPELSPGEEASLFIGPEGGWSPEEIALFAESKATALSFGKRILRAETACIAGSTLILTNR